MRGNFMNNVFNDESIEPLSVEQLAPFIGCKVKVGTILGGHSEIIDLNAGGLAQIDRYSHIYTAAPLLRPLTDMREAEAYGPGGIFNAADHVAEKILNGEITAGYQLAIKPRYTARLINRFFDVFDYIKSGCALSTDAFEIHPYKPGAQNDTYSSRY